MILNRRTPLFYFVFIFGPNLITLVNAYREVFDYSKPEDWVKDWEICNGTRQSPIELDYLKSEHRNCRPLKLEFPKGRKMKINVTNAGKTIEMVLRPINGIRHLYYVTGGRLEARYRLEKMIFHWGGNEHTTNTTGFNQSYYAMEIHHLFYNENLFDLDNALSSYNGVVALAVFVKLGHHNPDMETVSICVRELKSTEINKYCSTELYQPEKLFPLENFNSYYTYKGSLSTPPCNEEVTWIVFTTPIEMSNVEISTFKSFNPDGNIRQIHPRNNRVVHYNNQACQYHHHN